MVLHYIRFLKSLQIPPKRERGRGKKKKKLQNLGVEVHSSKSGAVYSSSSLATKSIKFLPHRSCFFFCMIIDQLSHHLLIQFAVCIHNMGSRFMDSHHIMCFKSIPCHSLLFPLLVYALAALFCHIHCIISLNNNRTLSSYRKCFFLAFYTANCTMTYGFGYQQDSNSRASHNHFDRYACNI